MERHEIISHVMHEVDGIIDRQRTIDSVRRALDERARDPHEEDFIYGEGTNNQKVFRENIDGVIIEKTILHRRGAADTDISGADLLFEIVGEKYVLVQYKRADGSGRIKNDESQLEELIGSCSNDCPEFRPYMLGNCGAWYALIDGKALSYMPACVASKSFAGRSSCKASNFQRAIEREAFLSAFAKCYIGARTAEWPYSSYSPSALMLFGYESSNPLVIVRQLGRFRQSV
ncbi:hypothetical protein [Stenotrophomonas sp. SAU14A_NAIMI4_8]|uniref:hypothetical protein n=1 Tax=Stenotrophomonas sp. SAU14A_NAIMI4_8 TaxID=2072409 RepID=UPI00131EDD2B|nr:hypothetical protein [Stenotrophomonas sp. SAU14A_NAIMI4_8]